MSNRTIEDYLKLLNSGKYEEFIFLKEISVRVEVARVWNEEFKWKSGAPKYFDFFFIKNNVEKYVGAVYDSKGDLSWYVSPEYRKKGYLTLALKSAILPYLFCEVRSSQIISIDKNGLSKQDYHNSLSVANKIGFVASNREETLFELNHNSFDWSHENLKETNAKLTEKRIGILKKRIFEAYVCLFKVGTELVMSGGDDKGVLELADKVNDKMINL